MSDLTGTVSNSKKWISLVKYMIIIFVWLLILIVSPDSIKEFFLEKTELPYSYQFFVLSVSVLIYPLFLFFIEKRKKSRYKNKIDKTLKKLDDDELDILFYYFEKKVNSLNLDINDNAVRGLTSKGFLINAGQNPIGSLYTCTFTLNDIYKDGIERLYYELPQDE